VSTPQPLGAVLKRIREMPLKPKPRPGERCELCGELIPDEHGHIVDLESRALMCACRPCYLVFAPEGAGGSRFRAVPDRYVWFSDFTISAAQWDALQIPVGVAFFFMNSSLNHIAAFYPSPAGATESLLSLDSWSEIVAVNPDLAALLPDVEALLVRTADRQSVVAQDECYLVPIDVCYELVGRLRQLWKGFDGGSEAHAALEEFFEGVRTKAHAAVASRQGIRG
jgi:hypothetical protein